MTRTRSRVLRFLAALSGLLLIRSIARFVGGYVLGYRRPCVVSLSESGLVVDARTYLAGKLVRQTTTRIPPWKLDAVTREDRFRHAQVLVGTLFFVLGVGLGFGLVVEWAWTRFGIYLLMGLGAIALGIALDAAVIILVPVVRRRSSLVIATGRRLLRIDDVEDGPATRFIEEMERWLAQARPGRDEKPSEREPAPEE